MWEILVWVFYRIVTDIYIYISYIYIYIHTHIYIYNYIYIARERERERERAGMHGGGVYKHKYKYKYKDIIVTCLWRLISRVGIRWNSGVFWMQDTLSQGILPKSDNSPEFDMLWGLWATHLGAGFWQNASIIMHHLSQNWRQDLQETLIFEYTVVPCKLCFTSNHCIHLQT